MGVSGYMGKTLASCKCLREMDTIQRCCGRQFQQRNPNMHAGHFLRLLSATCCFSSDSLKGDCRMRSIVFATGSVAILECSNAVCGHFKQNAAMQSVAISNRMQQRSLWPFQTECSNAVCGHFKQNAATQSVAISNRMQQCSLWPFQTECSSPGQDEAGSLIYGYQR